MNVFILCTGRCGSTTFVRACSHMTNFTAGHETLINRVGAARLAYPDNHIEADNRLAWVLGRLDETYGDRAFYVHLVRDRDEVARSFDRRWYFEGGIARAYRQGVLMLTDAPSLDCCYDMIETVGANIRHFLKDKSNRLDFSLEKAAEDFPEFWRRIGAEGDLGAAMAEWTVQHNASVASTPPGFKQKVKQAMRRVISGA